MIPGELAAALDDELPDAIALRHAVHREPRLSGDEADTRDAALAALAGLPGVSEPVGVAKTGALVTVGRGAGGDVGGARPVAVRAELDALPVVERTGLPFSSSGPAAHVCGHDVHLAALVAVARAVSRATARAGGGAGVGRGGGGLDLTGTPLLVVLQPREETAPSGAADVAADPAFRALDPRAMLGVHVQPELARGVVSVRPGAVNASADEVDVVVRGRAGHGGYPHRTVDPVLAIAAIVVSAQQVVARRTDPLRAGVVTFGQITAGTAPNVVPESATARATVRALDADRDALLDALREVAHHTAAAHGCTVEVTVVPNEPAVVNDAALARAVAPALGALGSSVLDTTFRSCGADDFAHYGSVLPSLMMFVGTGDPGSERGSGPGLHHPEYSPDDAMVGEVAHALLAAVVAAGTAGTLDPAPDEES